MMLCPICGNEVELEKSICRYCGGILQEDQTSDRQAVTLHKTVNLKHGRPLVETAIQRLEQELKLAKSQRVTVLTLIHGYGSSGRGGKIRVACRRMLDHLVQQKELSGYICGEEFNKRSGFGKDLLRRYPQLERMCASDFNNPGVTIALF